jgi:hypothetical protein
MGVVRASSARSQLFLVGIWLLATLLLVAVTQTIGVSEAAGDLTPGDSASDFELVGADPAAEPFPSALHGGLMWSVTATRATPAPELLMPAIVEVDLNITNTLSETQLRVPDSMLGLVALDREAETGGRFVGGGGRLAIEPGQTAEVTASFKVSFTDEPDPAALGLRVREPSRIPAIIPLDGEPPPGNGDYPVMAAIDTSPAVLVDPDDRSRQIVIEPQAVAIDINAGAYRAAEGQQLAIVQILIQRTSSNETSGFLDTGYWSIEADGEAVSPILATRTDQPASNADQIMLLFDFPADAVTDLKLVASANSDEAETFPIVVPR